MTRRVGNTIHMEREPDAPCQLCGTAAELRPAGPNAEQVCLPCADKNPAALAAYIDGLAAGLGPLTVVEIDPN